MAEISPPKVDMPEIKTTGISIDNDSPTIGEGLEFFRPMLADKIPSAKNNVPTQEEVIKDLKKLNWERGFLVSPKLDGIRCIKHPTHGLVTRTLTQVPNRFIQECLGSTQFDFFDGELVKGTPEEMVEFNDTQSVVMTQAGSPFFTFCVFDDIEKPRIRFNWRTHRAMERIEVLLRSINFQDNFNIAWVPQKLVNSVEELMDVEEEYLLDGYEGIIIRDPWGAYKNNRSTFKQQGMIKLKRFLDAEARVIGFKELYRNTNELEVDARGYAKRSSKLEGKVPAGTLGKLVVEGINGPFRGVVFEIGVGFTEKQRQDIWDNPDNYIDRFCRYKYQAIGSKNAPRIPTFLNWRDPRDTDVRE